MASNGNQNPESEKQLIEAAPQDRQGKFSPRSRLEDKEDPLANSLLSQLKSRTPRR